MNTAVTGRHQRTEADVKASARQIFQRYVRTAGLRWTPERARLLELVFESHDHFTIDELFHRAESRKLNISRATIYRTVPLLAQCKLIDRTVTHEGETIYEHTHQHEHHDHLICIQCGLLIEFRHPDIEALQGKIAEAHGFRLTHHTLQLYGFCRDCAAKGVES